MRILLIGNSLMGCLLERYRLKRHLTGHEVAFLVVPGAEGPDLVIEDDRLLPREPDRFPHNRPFCWPADAWRANLQDQDVLIIGTLAFLDDPQFPGASLLGKFCIPSFNVRPDLVDLPMPLTRAVAASSLRGQWSVQPGVVLANALRLKFSGRMLVLPYPAPSQAAVMDPSGHLRRVYEYPATVAYFLESQRRAWLLEWCDATGLEMLDYQSPTPDAPWTANPLMAADRFHIGPQLSEEIWMRIEQRIT